MKANGKVFDRITVPTYGAFTATLEIKVLEYTPADDSTGSFYYAEGETLFSEKVELTAGENE